MFFTVALADRGAGVLVREIGWLREAMRRAGFTPPPPVGRANGGVNPALRQRRFWEHHIRDETDYAAHVRYCWTNPVKHGLVAHAVDWPYSSIHRDIARAIVEPEWAGVVVAGRFGEQGR